ncbi:lactadherin-like [Anneissia japonica]|uniref:lactadherin-like n=1 Tax=Anneissia japonica TaxID=1529436 RepID=UPI001425A4AC|nr:lactadherin-like [Anneissia japonica]
MTQLVCILSILGLLYSLAISEKCDKPLGLESGNVRPDDIHASSELDKWHGPDRGRLNLRPDLNAGGSWTAKTNDQSQWIQVNMRRVLNVSGIITQGRSGHYSQWVTSFIVLYSMDAQIWENVTDIVGDTMTFAGNDDQDTEVTNMFSSPVMALYIRLTPTSWHEHISLRFEVLICKETENKKAINESCTTNALGMESRRIPSINIQASSELRDNFGARRARLNSVSDSDGHGGWIAAKNNMNQWIQVDLGASKYVTGVITQGYENGWVTRFEIQYGDDRNIKEWKTVRLGTGSPVVFEGNLDGDTAVTNIFPELIITRFLRIHPVEWHYCILLRFEILGCPGRLNPQTNCSDVFEMTSEKVSLTASSNYLVGRYWFPDYDREHPWIQADFGVIKKITGVTTRGSVTSFTILYSMDGNNMETVIGEGNHVMEFPGNVNDVEKVNIFMEPVITQFIRIQPMSWKSRVTLRFQIIVCPGNISLDERYQPLGMESRDIPSGDIESSSKWDNAHGPRRARLNNIKDSDGRGAWSSRYNTNSQWIQVNFRKLTNISGVITQGRSDVSQWVESYQVLYSTNGDDWSVILNSLGTPKTNATIV